MSVIIFIPRRYRPTKADKARRSAASPTSPLTRSFTPLGNSTSIVPATAVSGSTATGAAAGSGSAGLAMTETGTNPVSSPDRNCLRQVESWPELIPYIRQAKVGDEPGVTPTPAPGFPAPYVR
jgi:hypothetical protein